MLRMFLKALFVIMAGGLSGLAVCTADVTSPVLQAAAGAVGYFIVDAPIFRIE